MIHCLNSESPLKENTGYLSEDFNRSVNFLSSMRHPNIILYLGIHQDGDTGLPVLLMELMEDSLTNYLESSSQTIPYPIQVNICYDIALALSFLYSNKILH